MDKSHLKRKTNPYQDKAIFQGQIAKSVADAIGTLSKNEQAVIRLHFGLDDEPMTLSQIALRARMSEFEVTQVLLDAIHKLQKLGNVNQLKGLIK